MSSIGPQLPPHLQKRKRTPEDDDAPESPPSKTMRPANSDEIDLDDDSSDDGYGPSTVPAPQKAPQHGPTRPSPSSKPTTSPSRPSIGPAIPSPTSRPSIGPTPPPAPLSTLPPSGPQASPDSDSDADSDDSYGPSLPTSTTHQSRLSALPTAPSYTAPEPPKRDDWMLAPPSAPTGYRERDPTKLKARKFATGKAAAGNEAHSGGVSAIWTETPEQKAKRLRDAVLGRGGEEAARRPVEEKVVAPRGKTADEDKIRSFTEQTRGKSLYEEHQLRKNKGREEEGGEGKGKGKKKGPDEEDDDPSKRAFSWEKDMKSSGTISHTQRRQLLAKSADFGGRFDKGRYL
ncbi:hypothetical protein BR93DRAFT_727219 [Coniochaeta sp. PMI_546]|nr:hypothetical protein BR93DRAFT_727219 [Coniochaeta sp. PMI_546]